MLLTIHHGLCILEQLRDCSEQWDADNAKEPKLQQQRARRDEWYQIKPAERQCAC